MNDNAYRTLKRTTFPTLVQEPVSVNELASQAKIDKSAVSRDGGLIGLYIAAARDLFEQELGIILAQSNWQFITDEFDFESLPLTLYPLNSVTGIQYYALDDTLQTVDPAIYNLDLTNTPGRIKLRYNAIWPYTSIGRPDAVIATFNAGYAPGAVPPSLKLAVLMTAAEFYSRRTPVTEMRLSEIPIGIGRLLRANNRGMYF